MSSSLADEGNMSFFSISLSPLSTLSQLMPRSSSISLENKNVIELYDKLFSCWSSFPGDDCLYSETGSVDFLVYSAQTMFV